MDYKVTIITPTTGKPSLFKLIDSIKKQNISCIHFLLWDDEDTESNNSLVEFSASGIECFDLTDGLIKISKSYDAKNIEEPKMPEKEQTSKDEETPKAEEDEEDEEYEDEDEEEDADVMENLYYGIRAMAQIFAEAFVEALGDAPIKPSKGPKE